MVIKPQYSKLDFLYYTSHYSIVWNQKNAGRYEESGPKRSNALT